MATAGKTAGKTPPGGHWHILWNVENAGRANARHFRLA
jgi:hypothetical protein